MISISSDVLQAWISGFLWPLTRVLGLIAMAPVFSHMAVPQTVRLGLGVFITLIIAPTIPTLPVVDLMSLQGLLILVQQLIIGLAMGFTMRLVFTAVEMAGQISGMMMGLGFASFYDPQSQGQSTAVSQFFIIIAMLLFLSVNGHLLLIMTMTESFMTLPITIDPSDGLSVIKIVTWGEKIFSTGLHLSLPIIAALLMTNLALGILNRSAPQLNLFGIGFPITIGIGFVVIALVLPRMAMPLEQLMQEGLSAVSQIATPAKSARP
jgi:flagellar biosynthetic protein FliR